MWQKIVYREKFGRRPVLFGRYPIGADRENVPPRAWCAGCGQELYKQNAHLCRQCREERNYDK